VILVESLNAGAAWPALATSARMPVRASAVRSGSSLCRPSGDDARCNGVPARDAPRAGARCAWRSGARPLCTNAAALSSSTSAQDRLGGVAGGFAELLLHRAPDLVARGRGDHARVNARAISSPISPPVAPCSPPRSRQLEVGQVDALGRARRGPAEEDLAARERELADREALRLAARAGLVALARAGGDVARDALDVRAARPRGARSDTVASPTARS
jgi:hypothetical protein